jgi:hypothetical protein
MVAADLPYAGKWKMNPAKSDFGETRVTITDLGSGETPPTPTNCRRMVPGELLL